MYKNNKFCIHYILEFHPSEYALYLLNSSPYVIFSQDLLVNFTTPPAHDANDTHPGDLLEVQLISQHYSRPIHSVTLSPRLTQGRLTFPCGLIDFSGNFIFRIVDRETDAILFRTKAFRAVWPGISIAPSKLRVIAVTETLSVTLAVMKDIPLLCEPIHLDLNYSVSLESTGEVNVQEFVSEGTDSIVVDPDT